VLYIQQRIYTWGELTSQSLWSRYARHFVGITRYNVLHYMAKIYRVIQIKSNQIALKMFMWLPTYQQSVFKRCHIDKHFYGVFAYKMAAKINWHRYGTKLRHCHPMYTLCAVFIRARRRLVLSASVNVLSSSDVVWSVTERCRSIWFTKYNS